MGALVDDRPVNTDKASAPESARAVADNLLRTDAARLRAAVLELLGKLNEKGVQIRRGEVALVLQQALDLAVRVAGPELVGQVPTQLRMSLPGDVPAASKGTAAARIYRAPAGLPPPSQEQEAAIEGALANRVIKVRAGAGSGKTTLLENMTYRLGRGGVYLVFNASMRRESQRKFPKELIEVHTFHSMAHRYTNPEFKRVGKGTAVAKIPLRDILEHCGWPQQRSEYSKGYVLRELMAGFCHSADEKPQPSHLPEQAATSLRARLAKQFHMPVELVGPLYFQYLRNLCPLAQSLFEASTSKSNHNIPLSHDTYLKLFAMSGAKLDYRYILCDESQDLSPVMLQIIESQTHAKIVLVGDGMQQIYGFRGAIDALDRVDAPEFTLTGCYRFGPNIAEVANAILKQANSPMMLRGLAEDPGEIVDSFGPDDKVAYIARTNAEVIGGTLQAIEKNKAFHLVGGVDEICEDLLSAHALSIGDLPNVTSALFRGYETWDMVKHVIEETGDVVLARIMKLIDEYGPRTPELVEKIKVSAKKTPAEAEVIFGTAHKVKGYQFPYVFLADDFQVPGFKKNGKPTSEAETKAEFNLLYVAASRAMKKLRLNSVVQTYYDMARAKPA